jgi:hypothetical protein
MWMIAGYATQAVTGRNAGERQFPARPITVGWTVGEGRTVDVEVMAYAHDP